MVERRYTDDEVAEILDRATTAKAGLPAPHREAGTTLAELRDIAAEVGIPKDRIDEAAKSISVGAQAPPPARQTFLGAPRSVERTFHLERGPSDEEWGRIVADLRKTFNAQGLGESQGTLRSWRNGNLKIDIEPGAEGYSVRMRTLRGTGPLAVIPPLIGISALTLGLILTGETSGLATTIMYLITGGGLAGAVGALARFRRRLPKWAQTRADQMEALSGRIPLMLKDGE